jgi:hypothetical protein
LPNIVIIGTLSKGDYKVTYPVRLSEEYHNEEGYQKATEIFYPAIDEADIVIVYGDFFEHTLRDLKYAYSKGKNIIFVSPDDCVSPDLIQRIIMHREWFLENQGDRQ